MNGRIIVHSLAHARAAISAAAALGLPVTLASAPRAGGYGGALWFKQLAATAAAEHPTVAVTAVLDCGDEPGTALAALRVGLKRIRFTGSSAARDRLEAVARALDATVEGDAPVAALDLVGRTGIDALCRDFLGGCGTEDRGSRVN